MPVSIAIIGGEERSDGARLFIITGEGRHGMVTGFEESDSVSMRFKVGR